MSEKVSWSRKSTTVWISVTIAAIAAIPRYNWVELKIIDLLVVLIALFNLYVMMTGKIYAIHEGETKTWGKCKKIIVFLIFAAVIIREIHKFIA